MNMVIEDFIENFAEQFEETDASEITAETKFRELDEWSSLTALSVMAMIDEEYDVQIKADEMRRAETIEDLLHIVESHQ